jgi:hypothetical protein
MPREPAESLEAFLLRQEAPALVAVLIELATDHDAVRQRLARMQLADRPDKLAAGFRKTLAAWRRSTKFHGYREALAPLQPHESFEAEVRSRHARKAAFWAHVNGKRKGDDDAGSALAT